MHADWLIAFTTLLSTNEKTFAIECRLLKRMLDGETPFKTNSRKWFGLNILDILFTKTPKKQHNMLHILQKVDADKQHKVCKIDRDCKCKFSYT